MFPLKNRLIPRLAPLRYRIDGRLASRRLVFQRRAISKKKINDLFMRDASRLFEKRYTNLKALVQNNEFVSFGGSPSSFISDARNRRKLDFLLLLYAGKSPNHIETPYRDPDLSFAMLMNRFNAFAEKVEEITGKESRVVIATENAVFDRAVLKIDGKKSAGALSQSQKLTNSFGFKKIVFVGLEALLPNNFQALITEELRKLKGSERAAMGKSGFKDIFSTFWFSVPTHSFQQAVRLYTSKEGTKKARQWTLQASLRYMAFLEARYRLDFWKAQESRYIRSSVSPKANIVNFAYSIGRATPPHGVAILKNSDAGTERFYDLVKAKPEKEDMLLFEFLGKPFFFRT